MPYYRVMPAELEEHCGDLEDPHLKTDLPITSRPCCRVHIIPYVSLDVCTTG